MPKSDCSHGLWLSTIRLSEPGEGRSGKTLIAIEHGTEVYKLVVHDGQEVCCVRMPSDADIARVKAKAA